jgi:hypothetical protein
LKRGVTLGQMAPVSRTRKARAKDAPGSGV